MAATARILIVEDDAIVARDLKASLTKMGYFVTDIASSGEDALDMAALSRPDLVLMDIMFGGDLDGIETAQRLRDRFDIPVIYLTAYGDEATFARAKQTLPLAYVLKPFDAKELYLTIETSLERRRLENELEASEERWTALLGAVHDGVIVTDAEGAVTSVNRLVEALTGYKSAELKGTDWTDLLAPVEPPRRLREIRAQSDGTGEKAAELRAKNKTTRFVKYDSAPIIDRKGKVSGVVFVFRA
jgi:PAS domain S-box-containing protein